MSIKKLDLQIILENCYFVPMSTVHKVIDIMEVPPEVDLIDTYCKRNLVKLQQSKTNTKTGAFYNSYCNTKFKSVFRAACHRAIYSHNWNKLLYLLKKCPPWKHDWKNSEDAALYVRALLILLMYHPSSQAQGLLNDYLHLVWSCRTDADKKAVLKILLTLPEKLQGSVRAKPQESNLASG